MDVTIEDGVGSPPGILGDTAIANYWNNNWNHGGRSFHNLYDISAGDRQPVLFKVDLSAISGTVVLARFGIHIYGIGGSFYFDVHEVLRDWNEGNKNVAAADEGEVTWMSARYLQELWTTPGCLDDGTDRNGTPDGNYLINATDSDYQFGISNTLTQKWLDNSTNNNGVILWPSATSGGYALFRTSETSTGNKPYFYIEYTEGPAFNPSWVRNSNQVIGVNQ